MVDGERGLLWLTLIGAVLGVARADPTTEAAGLNPIDGPASAWAGANVLQLWGEADTTITPAADGAAMRAMHAGQPALDLVDIRPGGDHSSTNGSYLQVEPMMSFLRQVTGTPPDPPELKTYLRVLDAALVIAGRRYPLQGAR